MKRGFWAGVALATLAFFVCAAGTIHSSAPSDGIEINLSPLGVRASVESSWLGDSLSQNIFTLLMRNGTADTMDLSAQLDIETYLTPSTFSIETSPYRAQGPASVVIDTTWDGSSLVNLLAGSSYLLPGQIAVLKGSVIVDLHGDTTSLHSVPVTVWGDAGPVYEKSTNLVMRNPVEPLDAELYAVQFPSSVTWVDATHTDVTLTTLVANPSSVVRLVGPGAVLDTTANYVTGGGSSFAITSAPAFVAVPDTGVSVTMNTAWDGTSSHAQVLTIEKLNPQAAFAYRHTLRVTHDGSPARWTKRSWASATCQGNCIPSTVEAMAKTTFEIAQNPSVAIIGASMKLGTPTGTATKYALPCSVIVKNLAPSGGASFTKPNVRWPFGAHFPATSELDSVRSLASKRFVVNPAFDASADHDSCLRAVSSEALAAGQADTVTFTAYFHAGNKTTWSTIARGIGLGAVTITDSTNCGGVIDEDGDGNPNEDGENDWCAFQVAPADSAPILAPVKASKAGNAIFAAGFAQGQVDSAVVVSGHGLALRDSLGTVIVTQYGQSSTSSPLEPLRFTCWPDGSLRICQMAANFTHSGTWDIITPTATQTGTAVVVTENPNFNIKFKKSATDSITFDLARSQLSSALPANGLVVRRAFVDSTDGGSDYLGSPGAMEYRVYVDTWSDGTLKSWVAIRNQRRASTWGQAGDAGTWGGDVPSEQTCAVTFLRETSDTMRIRWASDMGLGSGVDTSIVSAWHAESYDHPDFSCDVNGDGTLDDVAGEQYDFGGRWRAGEELRFQIVEAQDPEPPIVLHSADWYIQTKAMPWTDTLVKHRGAAWSSPDSILSVCESHMRTWARRVQDENPPASWWRSPLMFGNQYRQFDGSCGTAVDACRGGSQYETDLMELRFLFSIQGVSVDSLNGYAYTDSCWKSIEQQVNMDWQSAYNVDYDPEARKNGIVFPHTEHGTTGLGNVGRSSQKPTGNYLHGLALYPVMMMTGNPLHQEDWNRRKSMIATRISNIGGAGDEFTGGEGRQQANLINWAWLICDFEPSATRWNGLSQCINSVAARWASAWNDDPRALGCASAWKWQKPWQLVYEAVGVQQAERVQARWSRFSEAAASYALHQHFALHTISFQTGSKTTTIRDVNCSNPSTVSLRGMFYQDGIKPACFPSCESLDDRDVCVDFWNTLAAGCIAQHDEAYADLLMHGCARQADEGNYNCPFGGFGSQYYQKQGIIGLWYMEWAKARGY